MQHRHVAGKTRAVVEPAKQMHAGALLRKMRKRAGLSYAEVAHIAGITAEGVRRLESGLAVETAVGIYYTPKELIEKLASHLPLAVDGQPDVIDPLAGGATFLMHFADRLRAARKQSGLSLREIARRAAMDPTYLSRLERGVVPPPAWSKIQALAATLAGSRFAVEVVSIADEQTKRKALGAAKQLEQLIEGLPRSAFTDEEWGANMKTCIQKSLWMLRQSRM